MNSTSKPKPQARPKARGIWRWISTLNRYNAGVFKGRFGPSRLVLLLTTTGRRTGNPHVTPLQYEKVGDMIYVASARGTEADWFKNLVADPQVQVQMRGRTFSARAEAITDPGRVADFLALRLRRHPLMIRLLMRAEGLPWRHTRTELEAFAGEKALAALHPVHDGDPS
jgi:deazaflavin-dependent oxidoreductase (nitroreductase family)